MQKKLMLTAVAFGLATMAFAQTSDVKATENESQALSGEAAFTFTESQLGEDDDVAQNVTLISSNTNLYASQVGYGFSAMRFRYRALNQKYNDVYVNGMQLNDMETGQFRFSLVGGLNNQTRSQESSLPFEDNLYSLSGIGGSNNYDFRSGDMATGHKASLLACNRNYTLRGMYTYNSGFNNQGWAWSASVTYRWSDYNTSNVKGTFYNSLSYFLGVEKILGNHRLSLSTWGNPTERATAQGATDEMYWLANSNFYNANWGYQNGKVRNSRIVNDFAPSAVFTWDWKINDKTKLTTSLGGRYSMYKSTKLNYNNSDNPHPDYWKNMPSAYYDVWDQSNQRNNEFTPVAWQQAVDYFKASEENRQIKWDRLYAANHGVNVTGKDAMYFIQAKNNDALNLQLNSVLNLDLDPFKHLTIGFGLGTNSGRHYQTMEDLLGAQTFHNINTYALSDYGEASPLVRYDLNEGPQAKEVREGDVFGYDYYINVNKVSLWAAYTANAGRAHFLFGAKTNYWSMQRDGKMRSGLAANNSYGKSGIAQFADGGAKTALSLNLGAGNAINFGLGYETRAPQAAHVFAAPEINNDFCINLHNENIFSSEVGYQLRSTWVNLNLSAYYNYVNNGTDWQNYYFDDENSFTYVSLTDLKKVNYGLEAGMRVKILSSLSFKAFGTISDAYITNDCRARYMMSTSGRYTDTPVFSEGMRESGTPLTAVSLGLSYSRNGWFIDLAGNWYDRIYLSWSPSLRYRSSLETQGLISTGVNENGDIAEIVNSPAQAMGHGGWMVDASIGKSMYLKHGSLSINLSLNNILNNVRICTGGYEQSRSSYTTNADGSYSGARMYSFLNNPKKFYAYGTNGMLNITYKF